MTANAELLALARREPEHVIERDALARLVTSVAARCRPSRRQRPGHVLHLTHETSSPAECR